jgi:hypothetical protein
MPGADPRPSPVFRPIPLTSVIESHLEKILGSEGFTDADNLRRLLRFVVHETIGGRGDDIKEYNLGVSVLARGESFDPKADPIVRVQMRRLREHLARYYAEAGRNDALIIDIPKGRYIPLAAAQVDTVGDSLYKLGAFFRDPPSPTEASTEIAAAVSTPYGHGSWSVAIADPPHWSRRDTSEAA